MSLSTTECPTGKEAYGSKSEALVVASRIVKRPRRKGGDDRPYKMRVYRCDCGQWHLTKRVR